MTDVSAVNPYAPTGPAATDTGSASSAVADELGADVFLKLLVAQLKYQDPTSPAEGTEFLAQTAQFTMVEKLTQLAEQAEANAVMNRNLGAATMVGRSISWLEADGAVGEGTVESARLGSAGPILVVNGYEVPFDAVASVNEAAPATVAAPLPTPNQPDGLTSSQTTDASPATSATDGTNDTTSVT